MRRYCELCERKIHLVVPTRRQRQGVEAPQDHTLCWRCCRQLRDRLLAERQGPKPWWAMRPTLRILNGIPVEHGRYASYYAVPHDQTAST